jgi:hypothetical protein
LSDDREPYPGADREADDFAARAAREIIEAVDAYEEPVDSCDRCGVNIYEDEDDGSGLCDQCRWREGL